MSTTGNPEKISVRPASSNENAGIFYALPPEQDAELGCIGHVRIDFGRSGKEFWHTWHPRGPEELNSPEFKENLSLVVDTLRESVLKDLPSMKRFCHENGGEISGGWIQNYGYIVETENYQYCIRCNPVQCDYQCYVNCFDKRVQQMHQTNLLKQEEEHNMPIAKEWLTFLQEQYPVGSRVRIREMDDPHSELTAGSTGALEQIDEDGRFHLKLENGQSAVLMVGRDKFSVLPPEPVTLKLYMPLTADLFEYDEYRDLATTPSLLYSGDLLSYTGEIQEALINNRMEEESERGIMHWYSDNDTVNEKVQSVVFNAEVRDGRLWGVAECRVMGQLTPDELFTLKEYITGQASDGWGEGFEQREIRTDEGELYVHLWSFDHHWSIETEEERFGPQFADGLPEMCFSVSSVSGDLICLKRGESGYYPSQYNTSDRTQNENFANHYNEILGVSSHQRQAMEVGSLFGWNLPGADPKTYEQHQQQQEQQMGGMNFG